MLSEIMSIIELFLTNRLPRSEIVSVLVAPGIRAEVIFKTSSNLYCRLDLGVC